MKSKCCNKPLRLSRENPQRGETVYYICEGCNQPADPKDDYVDKNYPDEREVSKLKEASMQNEPHLSAELRKRFRAKFTAFDNVYADRAELEAFLATALEEQRKEILSEVERLESIKMYKIVGGNPLELLKKSDVLTIIN